MGYLLQGKEWDDLRDSLLKFRAVMLATIEPVVLPIVKWLNKKLGG